MNTEFCMHCGGKVEYALTVPNFCPSCGKPFNKEVNARDEDPPTSLEANSLQDSDALEEIPRISKLEYTIGGVAATPTFGDLMTQAAGNSVVGYKKAPPRPSAPRDPNEDIIKTTMAECQSAREPLELGE